MSDRSKKQSLVVPVVTVLLLLGFVVAYPLLGLPPSTELQVIFARYLTIYGYLIVFFAAFVEAVPPVNFYFPGSAVVVLAVASATDASLNIFGVLTVAAAAFICSYMMDYAIGRFGLHGLVVRCGFGSALEHSKEEVSRHGMIWLWVAAIHPNVGALAATSCGLLNIPFKRFALHVAAATVVWVALWGGLVHVGKDGIMKLLDLRWLLAVASIWLVFRLICRYSKRFLSGKTRDNRTVNPNEKA